MADTKINSAGEQQPVDRMQRYAEMSAAELKRRQTIDLSDEPIFRSLSAKAKNYDIRMPDGTIAHVVEGTYIRNKHVFAGYGTNVPFRNTAALVDEYGGVAEDWAKVKGDATIEQDGKSFDAEIHWCENPKLCIRTDFKFKRYL